jgi:uncharacterized protein YeaO (DUF488 family)
MIKIKRVYDEPAKDDGFRILIDGLWPRGLSKDKAEIDLWLKEIAVSPELRKWFSHDPDKWPQFKRRFYAELDEKKDAIALIRDKAKGKNTVTLLYGSKEEKYNNAVALHEYLVSKKK